MHNALRRYENALALQAEREALPVLFPSTAALRECIEFQSLKALALCKLCGVPTPPRAPKLKVIEP